MNRRVPAALAALLALALAPAAAPPCRGRRARRPDARDRRRRPPTSTCPASTASATRSRASRTRRCSCSSSPPTTARPRRPTRSGSRSCTPTSRGAASQVVLVSPNDPLALRLDEQGYTDLGDTLRGDEAAREGPRLDASPTSTTARRRRCRASTGRSRRRTCSSSTPRASCASPAAWTTTRTRRRRRPHDARDAIEAVLAGKPVPVETTKVFGCSVKWSDKRGSVKDGLREVGAGAGRPRAGRTRRRSEAIAAGDAKKLRLVNVWATWCGPCVIEFPDLVALHRIYRGRDFEVVTVNADDPDKRGKALDVPEGRSRPRRATSPSTKGDPYALIEARRPEVAGRAAAHDPRRARRQGDLPQRGCLRHARAAQGHRRLARALLPLGPRGELRSASGRW